MRHRVMDITSARLVGTYMPTTLTLYEADAPLTCADCGETIPTGQRFSRGHFPGSGRGQGDLCRSCRPFEVS